MARKEFRNFPHFSMEWLRHEFEMTSRMKITMSIANLRLCEK
jgi:hypothetical protein